MLLRIDNDDPGVAPTIQACASAVTQLADRGLLSMVEPLPYPQTGDGTHVLLKDAASLARAITVASALGTSSAYTWLKMPACEEPDVVYSATTLPCVVLGGAPGPDLAADLAAWGSVLRCDVVRGLVVGRSLLFPPDDDVAGAVHAAAEVLRAATQEASPS